MILRTVGYEGTHIEDFVAFLKKSRVKRIADVRKNPLSRKKGFSKNRLAENLKNQGIEYIHLPGLGVPSAWRKLAKEEKITRVKMFRDYVKKIIPLQTKDFETLEFFLKAGGLTLLCYEADASDCHRRYVAEELVRRAKKPLQVKNLHFPVGKNPARSLFRVPRPWRSSSVARNSKT